MAVKKRKPYGYNVSSPRRFNVSRRGWLRHGRNDFISLWGWVEWDARHATWRARIRDMSHDPTQKWPRSGFSRPRAAMMWVEEQFKLRDRKRTWRSILS